MNNNNNISMRLSKNKRRKIFTVTIPCIALGVVLATLIFVFLLEAFTGMVVKNTHRCVEQNFHTTDQHYLYVGDESLSGAETVEAVMEKLPEAVSDEIEDNWVILISHSDPLSDYFNASVTGTTYARHKLIWLSTGFSEATLVHEIGHAFAGICALDYSREFLELYNVFWSNYSDWYDYEDNAHETSTSAELFALLFEQYVCQPDALREEFPEGYDYMSEQLAHFGDRAQILNPLIKNYNTLASRMSKSRSETEILSDLRQIEAQTRSNAYIDPAQYEPIVHFSGLNEKEEALLNELLGIMNHPENYSVETYDGTPVIKFLYGESMTYTTYSKITACVDMYFGVEHAEVVDVVSDAASGSSTVYVRLEKVEELKQARDGYTANTDAALAGLREGTETQKLLQVSKYIGENCTYTDTSGTSMDDFWTLHEGDGFTYAVAFRQFCEQLGIPCDVVFGISSTGEDHVWNRVRLSDGTYRYYDLTRYQDGKIDMLQYDDCETFAINCYIN